MSIIKGRYASSCIPTVQNILPFVLDSDCYDVIYAVTAKFPTLGHDAGFFVDLVDHGTPKEHAWNVAPDGTIIDVTFSQFDPKIKVLFARPGTALYRCYYSYKEHHPVDHKGRGTNQCLLQKLGVKIQCQVPGCIYGKAYSK